MCERAERERERENERRRRRLLPILQSIRRALILLPIRGQIPQTAIAIGVLIGQVNAETIYVAHIRWHGLGLPLSLASAPRGPHYLRGPNPVARAPAAIVSRCLRLPLSPVVSGSRCLRLPLSPAPVVSRCLPLFPVVCGSRCLRLLLPMAPSPVACCPGPKTMTRTITKAIAKTMTKTMTKVITKSDDDNN